MPRIFKSIFSRISTPVLLIPIAAPAMAQGPIGTMDYGPLTAVPIGGTAMVVLGIMLAALAYWKLSSAKSSSSLASAFLALGALSFTLAGGQLLQDAYADMATTPLSKSGGGTVDIFAGYTEYENTSGVPLAIGNIDVESCEAPEVMALLEPSVPECTLGLTLNPEGGTCFTDYADCVDDPRVTNRAGYYWVRADYAAPEADHGSVCAEFGYSATGPSVTVTWDSALLADLAADFGYTSAGDNNNSAHLMSCWDGDGGSSDAPGTCSTHNFGATFRNYGTWSSDPDERPVFTCQEPD